VRTYNNARVASKEYQPPAGCSRLSQTSGETLIAPYHNGVNKRLFIAKL